MNQELARALASIVVCLAGGYSMYLTEGDTGIGWAALGLLIIWA